MDDIKKGTIAIPGELTTAYLLLRLYDPTLTTVAVMPYDRIMTAVADGMAAANEIDGFLKQQV